MPKTESIQSGGNFFKHKIASLKNRPGPRSKFNEKQYNPFRLRCFRFLEFFAVRATAVPSSRVFRGFAQRRERVQQLPSSNFSGRARRGRLLRRAKKIHRSAANHDLLRRFLNFLGCGRWGGGFRRAFYTSRRRRRGGRSFLFRVPFLSVKTTQAGTGNKGKCGKTTHNGFLFLIKSSKMNENSPQVNSNKNLTTTSLGRNETAGRKGKPHSTHPQRESSPSFPSQKRQGFFRILPHLNHKSPTASRRDY